jgi:hypothetical protein
MYTMPGSGLRRLIVTLYGIVIRQGDSGYTPLKRFRNKERRAEAAVGSGRVGMEVKHLIDKLP